MKVFKKLITFLVAAPLFLGSCIMNNGICYTHKDADNDGICDVCGAAVKTSGGGEEGSGSKEQDLPGNPCTTHVDHDLDGTCDVCGASMSAPSHDHIDGNLDGHCDICNATMIIPCANHVDANGDGKCDVCGASMPLITGDVTTYLVLSSVGLYKGAKGTTYSEVHVENAVKFIEKVGTALPTKDDVTHVYGSAEFSGWVAYDGAGAPTVYTHVPNVNNKILYAQFTPNGQTPVTPDPGPDIPVDSETWSFSLKTNFDEYNWSEADARIYAYCWDNSSNHRAYEGTKVDNNTFSFTILESYTGLLFLRMPAGVAFNGSNWDDKWNQSADLAIDHSKTTAQITGWDNGAGKCPVSWIS